MQSAENTQTRGAALGTPALRWHRVHSPQPRLPCRAEHILPHLPLNLLSRPFVIIWIQSVLNQVIPNFCLQRNLQIKNKKKPLWRKKLKHLKNCFSNR